MAIHTSSFSFLFIVRPIEIEKKKNKREWKIISLKGGNVMCVSQSRNAGGGGAQQCNNNRKLQVLKLLLWKKKGLGN